MLILSIPLVHRYMGESVWVHSEISSITGHGIILEIFRIIQEKSGSYKIWGNMQFLSFKFFLAENGGGALSRKFILCFCFCPYPLERGENAFQALLLPCLFKNSSQMAIFQISKIIPHPKQKTLAFQHFPRILFHWLVLLSPPRENSMCGENEVKLFLQCTVLGHIWTQNCSTRKVEQWFFSVINYLFSWNGGSWHRKLLR